MRRLFALAAASVAFLAATGTADAAYWGGPATPPSPTCTTTTSSVSTWQTNVNTGAAGTHCLSAGTYASFVTFNRTAAGVAVAASSGTTYGTIITGGILVNSSNVTLQGLDIQNSTNTNNLGDGVRIANGTSAVNVLYNKIHNTYRNGIQLIRPTCVGCVPASGYPDNVQIKENYIYDNAKTDTTGALIVARGGTSTNNKIENNDFTTIPNDAIYVWGKWAIRSNKLHDCGAPAGTNHQDFVQTWKKSPADTSSEGLDPDGVFVSRNRMLNCTDANAHFVTVDDSAGVTSGWRVRSNEVNLGSGGGHAVNFGTTGSGGSDMDLTGNTLRGSQTMAIWKSGSTGDNYGNLFRNCATAYTVTGATVNSDYNNASGSTCSVSETHGTSTVPTFVNEASGDLHLSGTSLRDVGVPTATYDIDDTDIDNAAREQGTADEPGADETG